MPRQTRPRPPAGGGEAGGRRRGGAGNNGPASASASSGPPGRRSPPPPPAQPSRFPRRQRRPTPRAAAGEGEGAPPAPAPAGGGRGRGGAGGIRLRRRALGPSSASGGGGGSSRNASGASSPEEGGGGRAPQLDGACLAALCGHLAAYDADDRVLDDDEVVRLSQRAHASYRHGLERRRQRLIFGPNSSSEEEDDDEGGRATSRRHLLRPGMEDDSDADPEDAMWLSGGVGEKFFDSVVVGAAVRESRRLASLEARGGGGGTTTTTPTTTTTTTTTTSPITSPTGDLSDAVGAAMESSDSEDGGNLAGSAVKLGPHTPITSNQAGSPLKKKDACSGGGRGPRVGMDDATIDAVRQELGMRESEFVFFSYGRRRKRHFLRPRHRHRHDYASLAHYNADWDDDEAGDEAGDEADGTNNTGSSRGAPRPTRVTRRLTKAHREKRREDRHARQLRGLETLTELAMGREVTVNGERMSTAKALDLFDLDGSSDDASGKMERDDDDEASSENDDKDGSTEDSADESDGQLEEKRALSIMAGEIKPTKHEEVPLYAMVFAAEYGKVRRRARQLMAAAASVAESPTDTKLSGREVGGSDDDSDDFWDGGTAYRPVKVVRLVVNRKPVCYAKLKKQINDAAKTRREKDARLRRLSAQGLQLETEGNEKGDPEAYYEEVLLEQKEERLALLEEEQQRLIDDAIEFAEDDEDSEMPLFKATEVDDEKEKGSFSDGRKIFSEIISEDYNRDVPGKVFNQPVSLSLFDYKRRQQRYRKRGDIDKVGSDWLDKVAPLELNYESEVEAFPSSHRNGKKRDLAELASSELDPSNETWQVIDDHVQDVVFADPPRLQSDLAYAKRCAELITCLSGSGGNFARREFFYSDIDRAWFNFDTFTADTAKLGLPQKAPLNRKERMLVRRNISKRPKRFSQHFVKSQLSGLDSYRRKVRKIQQSDVHGQDGFPYEIPAIISIGSTVTAPNRKANILHRGIVLDRREYLGQYGYLVQFERKDLGCQFCLDVEVASHGVPNVLFPASPCISQNALYGSPMGSYAETMDELKGGALRYGTSLGTRKSNKAGYGKASKVQQIPERTIVRSFILKALQRPTDAILSAPKRSEERSIKAEHGVERKALVKLLHALEVMSKRKEAIVKIVATCHTRWKQSSETDRIGRAAAEFTNHYFWLRANLDITNRAIDAATTSLRILYGKAYAGIDTLVDAEHEEERIDRLEASLQSSSSSRDWSSGLWDGWCTTVLDGSARNGAHYASIALCSGQESKDHEASGSVQIQRKYLDSRLASSAALLQIVKLCADGRIDCGPGANSAFASAPGSRLVQDKKPLDAGATRAALSEALKKLTPVFTEGIFMDDVRDMDAARESAFADLKEAVSMLHAELAEMSCEVDATAAIFE